MSRQVQTKIEIDGAELSEFTALTINQYVNQHHYFELRLPLRALEGGKNPMFIQKSYKKIGKEIKVEIAAKTGQTSGGMFFKGLITGINFGRQQQSVRDVTIYGYSPTILLDDGKNCRSFTEKSIKQITDTVIGDYPSNYFKTVVKPGYSGPIPYLVQYNETNYNFLCRLAQQYGEWFFYDGKELILGQLPAGDSITLDLGINLFTMDFSVKMVPVRYKWHSYDYLNHKVLESPSKPATVSGMDQFGDFAMKESDKLYSFEPVTTVRGIVKDKAALDDLVKYDKNMEASRFVHFHGSSNHPGIKPGCKLTIAEKANAGGATEEANLGKYLAVKVVHQVDANGNYTNRFEAISANLKHPVPNNALEIPVCEAQPAVVKDNHDPEGLGRVKVQFYWQQDPEKTPWIRLVTHHAAKDRGIYMIPELEDEVLVNFEHQDPDKPYVVGSLFHGKAKPPSDWVDADNNLKVFRTKSGNEVHINDENGKEEIRIINKDAANEISMTLADNGLITIKTDGKLAMKAKTIEMEAEEMTVKMQKSIEMKTQELKTEATNTTIESKAQAKIKASAQLDMDGGAMASLKGGLVKIN